MKIYHTIFSLIQPYKNIVVSSVFVFYISSFVFRNMNLIDISAKNASGFFLLFGLIIGFTLIPVIHFFRIKKYKNLIDSDILWHKKPFNETNNFYSKKIINSDNQIVDTFLLYQNFMVSFYPHYNNALVLKNDSIGIYIGNINSLALWFLNFEKKSFMENTTFIKFDNIEKLELNIIEKTKNNNSKLQLKIQIKNEVIKNIEPELLKINDFCYDKTLLKNKIIEENIFYLRIGEYFAHLYLLEDRNQKDKIRDKAIKQKQFIDKLNDLYPIENYDKNKLL